MPAARHSSSPLDQTISPQGLVPPDSEVGAGDTSPSASAPLAETIDFFPSAAAASTASQARTLLQGQTSTPQEFGRYRVVRKIASGAFGTVYLGADELLNRQVAIKVPSGSALRSRFHEEQFLNEARAAAGIRHPGIVAVYDFGRAESGRVYVVVEFVEGQPLSELIQAGPLEPSDAASLVANITEALQDVHEHGLIHRDLKPANILIDREGRPHIADFGAALRIDRDETGLSGSPAYMSPEQTHGDSRELDPRTDLWSLGVIFYELLTGFRPFEAPNLSDLFARIRAETPIWPSLRRADLLSTPRVHELEETVMRCLEKGPQLRFDSAQNLAAQLQSWLSHSSTVDSTPAESSSGVTPGRHRHRDQVTLLATAGIVIAFSSIAFWSSRLSGRSVGASEKPREARPPATTSEPDQSARTGRVRPLRFRGHLSSVTPASERVVLQDTAGAAELLVPLHEAARQWVRFLPEVNEIRIAPESNCLVRLAPGFLADGHFSFQLELPDERTQVALALLREPESGSLLKAASGLLETVEMNRVSDSLISASQSVLILSDSGRVAHREVFSTQSVPDSDARILVSGVVEAGRARIEINGRSITARQDSDQIGLRPLTPCLLLDGFATVSRFEFSAAD